MKLKKILSLAFVATLLMTTQSFGLEVERIAGNDRYDTANKVVNRYNNWERSSVVITKGNSFKEALYGSYMASVLKCPLIIVNNYLKKIDIDTLDKNDIKLAYVIGDYNQIPKNIDNTLRAKGISNIRIYPTKYRTAEPPYGSVHISGIAEKIESILYNLHSFNQNVFDSENPVMLINEDKFPDLLSATPLAADLRRNYGFRLTDERYEYRNNITPMVIFGGYNSVRQLENYNGGDGIIRFDGQDRYYTSIKIGDFTILRGLYTESHELDDGTTLSIKNRKIDKIFLVSGENYPDAISSGLAASMDNGIVVLTPKNSLNENVKQLLLEQNIGKVIIVGGENSVSKNVENELRSI